MVEITIVGENHGLEESIQKIGEIVRDRAAVRRTGVIFAEPIPSGVRFERATGDFSKGNISLKTFWGQLSLENAGGWGPSGPYKELYASAVDNGYEIRPLDQNIRMRYKLARGYVVAAEYIDMVSLDAEGSKSKSDVEKVKSMFELLRKSLVDERERHFANVVATYASSAEFLKEPKEIIIITHVVHTAGVAEKLKDMRFDAVFGRSNVTVVLPFSGGRLKEVGKREDEMQIEFAKKHKVLEALKPQIVPSVVFAYAAYNDFLSMQPMRLKRQK